MLDTIKTIILDSQENKPDIGVTRHLAIEPVAHKATICIGVRRSGKSTYLFQRIDQLLRNGVSPENILYLNFFDDRLHGLQQAGIGLVTEAYYSLYPEKKNTETVYCFFDEIQEVNGWEPFVDRLLRTEKCEIFITGSSAKMLSTEIATQMRGRALSWEMFPFSLSEFLDYRELEHKGPFSTKKQMLVKKAFDEYWEKGSFPEVTNVSKHLRIKIHQEYFHTILARDLIERHNISHPKAALDLAYWLIDNIASLYSVNRLTGYLKSQGHKITKPTVAEFVKWFEDAYFLFTLQIFDASVSRRNVNPKKIYCIDHALVTSVSSGILVNAGHLLENLVFIELRRRYTDIYYYKTQSGLEVDFIVLQKNRTKQLIQVSETLVDTKTYKRELRALEQAMAEQNLKEGVIVTRNEEDKIETESGIISIVPVWRFLLGAF
jgi:predicted AAA+ superfamily ATPase